MATLRTRITTTTIMFDLFLNDLDMMASEIGNSITEAEFVQELQEQMESSDPESIRMQTLERILHSPDAMELAIQLIADVQLWEYQEDGYGRKTGLYKPSTIQRKARAGFPADKLVNYTYYETGTFRRQGIDVEVNLEANSFDYFKTDRQAYFQYIPDDVVMLQPQNEEYLKGVIGEWLNSELDEWLKMKFEQYDINPFKYGLYF